MAVTCATGSIIVPGISSSPTVCYMRVYSSSWAGHTAGVVATLKTKWGVSNVSENEQDDETTQDESGNWTSVVGPLIADKTYKYAASIAGDPNSATGAARAKKTAAIAGVVGTPSSSLVTSISARLTCSYYPNTLESVATVWLEYKKATDTTWTVAGASEVNQQGYSVLSITRDLTGLLPATQYNFRLRMTRNTNVYGLDYTSTVVSFTTLAGDPVVTTNEASGVTQTTALLNGTLDINSAVGVNCYFKWGTDNPPTQNTTANIPMSADGSFQASISGLPNSTLHYVRAYASFTSPPGSPVSGDILSFTTAANPAAVAVQEAHVQTLVFDRKYGVQTTIPFAVRAPAATSSDLFVTTASPFAAGDVKISKDAGAFANTTNLPAQVTAGEAGRRLTLEAAELQCDEAHVVIHDASGTVFRDLDIIVRTHVQLGTVDIDAATGAKAAATAFKATGYGSGHGASFVAGAAGRDIDGMIDQLVLRRGTCQAHGVAGQAKLDASASGNDDYYNGLVLAIVGGTGVGQARVVVDYTGSTKVAYVDSTWVVNPDATSEYMLIGVARPWAETRDELSSLPLDNASFGEKMQLVFQRFAYKISQTSTVQTLFKADSSTSLATRSVSDAAGTQIVGKLS